MTFAIESSWLLTANLKIVGQTKKWCRETQQAPKKSPNKIKTMPTPIRNFLVLMLELGGWKLSFSRRPASIIRPPAIKAAITVLIPNKDISYYLKDRKFESADGLNVHWAKTGVSLGVTAEIKEIQKAE